MITNEVFKKYTSEETWNKIVDYQSVSEMWASCVKNYANKTAIVDGKEYTYSEIDQKVSAMRAALSEKGVGAGDRVGVFMPNSASFAVAFLAITTLGAVAALLPPHLDQTAVFGCSLKFGLKAIVYADAFIEKMEFTAQKNPAVILISENAQGQSKVDIAEVAGEAPCVIIFTGGTTGKNKGALLSNRAIMRGVKNGCFGIKEIFGLRYFLVLPLTHVFGLVRNLLTCLYTGSSIFICKNNKDMFKDIAVYKPSIMVLVPALAEMALNLSKQFKRNMLGEDMKTIICGASAVSPYLVKEYAQIGITLLPGYGLTESANLVSGNPEALKKPDSVGYIYEGMEYKIVNDELWLKGVNMMDGYVGEPEENQISYEDGYFKTGDLVRIDEEGFLYITGRKKEVIVLPSGENISPAEVESKFNELDTVQDCLITLENGVLALQVLPRMSVLGLLAKDNPQEYLKEQLNKVNDALPSFQRVSKIVIRTSDFVRSPSMKIVRNQNGL
ncbi:MAG: acyl--CoA ligase [Clostridiales bacterium]|nr:acyl--CoA ligase [Clostridiales bacterium]